MKCTADTTNKQRYLGSILTVVIVMLTSEAFYAAFGSESGIIGLDKTAVG